MSHIISETIFINEMRKKFYSNALIGDAIYYKERESLIRWFDTCKYSATDITPQMLYNGSSLKRYCKEAKFNIHDIKPFCIRLSIKGFIPIGRIIYDIHSMFLHLKIRFSRITKCK